jgi:hypothetical protein
MGGNLAISSQIRWRKMAGEAVIVNQADAELIVLNATGCRLWELLAEGKTPAAIAECIHREFEVDHARAVEDVNLCLASLQDLGIVLVDDQA